MRGWPASLPAAAFLLLVCSGAGSGTILWVPGGSILASLPPGQDLAWGGTTRGGAPRAIGGICGSLRLRGGNNAIGASVGGQIGEAEGGQGVIGSLAGEVLTIEERVWRAKFEPQNVTEDMSVNVTLSEEPR